MNTTKMSISSSGHTNDTRRVTVVKTNISVVICDGYSVMVKQVMVAVVKPSK